MHTLACFSQRETHSICILPNQHLKDMHKRDIKSERLVDTPYSFLIPYRETYAITVRTRGGMVQPANMKRYVEALRIDTIASSGMVTAGGA
jgi:hypothetical protein